MTSVLARLQERVANRAIGSVITVVSVGLGLLVVGVRTLPTFTGGGADMAHHYALVYWFTNHWSLPPPDDAALAEMTRYPPAAHVLAGALGRLVDSAFVGMHVVAIATVVLTWSAIAALLATLPGLRRWVALGTLGAVLALNVPNGPLQVHVHGFEIVGNFFFSQLAGQALVWWLVWFAVRRRIAGRSAISTAVLTAIIAVVSTAVHVLPAVELLVLVGCLSAAELLDRWRTGRRTLKGAAAPVLLPAATALAVVLTPGFRAMRTLSENDGALDVPYLSGLSTYVGVAMGVAVVSIALLIGSVVVRREAATAAALQGVGFAGLAIATPCMVQAILLAGGEGSPYAVKKYIFGLLTVLLVDACVAVSILVPAPAVDHAQPRRPWPVAIPAAVTVVATVAVLSHAGSGYSVSDIRALEQDMVTLAIAERTGPESANYAVALPNSDPVLDYMFSIGVLGAPKDQVAYALLRGEPPVTSGHLITAANSQYDDHECRRLGPHDGLVAVDSKCSLRTTRRCQAVNVLGRGGFVIDARLRGFSLAEPTGRWTDGRRASFSCEFAEPPDGPVTVAVDATAFLPSRVPRQRVTLAVGDERETFVLTAQRPHSVLRLRVPPPAPKRLTLQLTLPDAISPRAAGFSADARELALFVSEIRIG